MPSDRVCGESAGEGDDNPFEFVAGGKERFHGQFRDLSVENIKKALMYQPTIGITMIVVLRMGCGPIVIKIFPVRLMIDRSESASGKVKQVSAGTVGEVADPVTMSAQ